MRLSPSPGRLGVRETLRDRDRERWSAAASDISGDSDCWLASVAGGI